MPAINLVVSCTNRKRYPSAPGLALRDISDHDVAGRLRTWKERLERVPADRYPADELYIGDHWAVARGIPTLLAERGVTIRLWICSAGYGLVRSESLLKSYQATFTPGSEDYVAIDAKDRSAAIRSWWLGVCSVRLKGHEAAPRTLAQLAATQPRTPILVALSVDYLDAVADDLQEALRRPFFEEHLSIVSCGTAGQRHAWAHNLLPCDGLMSGSLGGTLTSINVRVARHLLSSSSGSVPTVEKLATLARSIPRTAMAPPERQPRSDKQVLAFIRKALRRSPAPSRSRLLREFRDAGLACEQGRFSNLYRAAMAMEAVS